MNSKQLEKENDELKLELITRFGELQTALEKNDELNTLLKERETQLEELQAHVERLREAYGILLNWEEYHEEELTAAQAVIDETPAQSLRHIESRVEEETIEEDAVQCDSITRPEIGEWLRNRPRKYKEQSDDSI